MLKDTWTLAFPTPEHADNKGMLLRDWFAGKALRSVLPDDGLAAVVAVRLAPGDVARACYLLADAMMEERNR